MNFNKTLLALGTFSLLMGSAFAQTRVRDGYGADRPKDNRDRDSDLVEQVKNKDRPKGWFLLYNH